MEKLYKDKDWLYQNYIIEKLTLKQIAKKCGSTDCTILNWLKKFDIIIRSQSESLKIAYKKGYINPKKYKKLSKKTRNLISKNHADMSGKNNPQWGKKGILSPNFGKPRSREHCKKLSIALTGKKRPHLTGKGNPNWRGGSTSLIQKIRSCKKYEIWRFDVFQRDNFKCQNCADATGHNLNAHHIKHLSKLIKELNIKTFNDALKQIKLWEINLGITLCEKCHDKEHKTKS